MYQLRTFQITIFITAYYKAERDFHSELTRSTEYTGQKFEKYLLDKRWDRS